LLLCDDDRAWGIVLRRLLGGREGIEVVGHAADGLDAIRSTREMRPDIVVTDLTMPPLEGVSIPAELRRAHPDVRIVVFSGMEPERAAALALDTGADCYVQKGGSLDELVAAVEALTH